MSLVVDISEAETALRETIAHVFDIDLSRIEIRSTPTLVGEMTVVELDIRVDGAPAPPRVVRLANDIAEAARILATT